MAYLVQGEYPQVLGSQLGPRTFGHFFGDADAAEKFRKANSKLGSRPATLVNIEVLRFDETKPLKLSTI